MHQIWIGGELPQTYRRWRERWIELHPHWEHHLWTDREIAELDFGTRDLFESTDHIGKKADILRAELLHRFGGLYVDTDYQCYRPLDPFHYRYDFYGTLRAFPALHLLAPAMAPRPVVICNSLVATRPGHPIFPQYLQKVRRLWKRTGTLTVSPVHSAFGRSARKDMTIMEQASKITYMPFHARAMRYLSTIGDDEPSIVLPPSYFNPVDWQWFALRWVAPAYWLGLVRYALRGGRGWPRHYLAVQPHSFTNHYSRGGWAES
jgi:hypothetical protein